MKNLNLKMKRDKMNCGQCGESIEILEIPGAGSKIKFAPCKHCGCDNTISSEKWTRGAAEVDLTNTEEVIQYIRDLFNLSDLLERGLDAELLTFIRMMIKAGYTDDRIHKYVTLGAYNTRYSGGGRKSKDLGEEYELGLGKDVPRPLPMAGDWREWMSLRPRAM